MIVQGVKKQVIDIEVDAEQIILDLLESWIVSIGFSPQSRLSVPDGVGNQFWETYERFGHGSDWSIKRQATDGEISEYNALQVVASIASQLD